MNKNNTVVIVLLSIIIVVLAYIAFKPKDVPVVSAPVTSTTGVDTVASNPSVKGTSTNVADANAITKSEWGVAFSKSPNWTVSSNTANKVVLTQSSGQGAGDILTAQYMTGSSITDGDGKFGNVTYNYDSATGKYMKIAQNEQTGQTEIVPAVAATYTKDGLPVFQGNSGWKTYIIPLSHTTYLKLNISGSGQTQSLEDLLATLHKI